MEKLNNDIFNINKPLNYTILEEIKNYSKIRFGYSFNFPVDNLPSTITHIAFDNRFNQFVNNLPVNLKNLSSGYKISLCLIILINQLINYLEQESNIFYTN